MDSVSNETTNKRGMLDKVLSIILIIAILATIGAVIYVITNPGVGERFTEFYILGTEGKAEGYPEKLAVGEEGKVILGIINQEHETMAYQVALITGGSLARTVGPIQLDDEEKWEEEIGFVLQQAGERQKVEFKLYKIREIGENETTLLSMWLGREYLDAAVTNQGQGDASYEMKLEIRARIGEDDEEEEQSYLFTTESITLGPGEVWDADIDYTYPEANWQNAELSLFRDNELIFKEDALGGYPSLHLWIASQ